MSTVYIIITGSLVSIACALLGNYLILRRMSMMGDAISHAVLPGIVLSYLWMGARGGLPMMFGAATFGLLCAYLIDIIKNKVHLQEDASIGISFTFLFSIGVILVSVFAADADIDADCVLHGELAFIPFDTMDMMGLGLPRALVYSAIVLAIVVAVLFLFKRQLNITTFDPQFAKALGMKTGVWSYLLMFLLSLVVVSSFEIVGAILVVALLIIPSSIAFLLTDRFNIMVLLSVVISVVMNISGYYISMMLDASIASAIVVAGGTALLAVSLLQKKRVSA